MAQSFSYTLLQQPLTVRTPASDVEAGTQQLVQIITYGQGIIAPLRRDGKGDFANANDIALVRSNLRQVLNTLSSSGSTYGELPWRPEFGTVLQLLRHRNLDETTIELARTYVVDAISTWLPRIRLKKTSVEGNYEESSMTIRVLYDILGGTRRNVLLSGVRDSVNVPVAA